ncbi:MAG TPA: hypothetical protein DDY34_05690, partial [Bacteroidales bacterium]|nr:hypothetical protein [Bacteroidales bacterium]
MKTKSFYIISLLWLLAIPTQADSGRIRIASCQFPVSADVMSNYRFIESQMIEAKLKKADVVH